MKETGILRRIDELGRIVIPKEIRKKLKIRNGDNLDIFTEGNRIILEKYNPLNNLDFTLDILLELVKRKYDLKVIVTDVEKVIASSKKEVIANDILSSELVNLISKNETMFINKETFITIDTTASNFTIRPIVSYGVLFGCLIYFYDNTFTSLEIVDLILEFSSSYIET